MNKAISILILLVAMTGQPASALSECSSTAECPQHHVQSQGTGRCDQNDGRVIERLIDADVASWTQYRDDVWTLARVFRDDGGRTAFLSNGVPEAMARIRADRPLERWFDVVVVSCEVGVAKPDPVIFQMCLTHLGVEPSHALFVDDRIENIEGAARLGLRTFHFIGADAVSRLVRSVRSLSA